MSLLLKCVNINKRIKFSRKMNEKKFINSSTCLNKTNLFKPCIAADGEMQTDNAFTIITHQAAEVDTEAVWSVVRAVPLLLLMICAMFGNSLVIISVIRTRKLRVVANTFIVSLAVADLLVAVLVMPFNASQLIAGIKCYHY